MNNKCIHCHACQKQCAFLKKYEMDVTDIGEYPELSYHCFLCGTCSDVCPVGIDGRERVLEVRRELAKDKNNLKPYRALLAEKETYIFRNDQSGKNRSVFFPGCNFVGYYPKTTQKIYEMLKKEMDCGILYDCCGKPVAELGLTDSESKMTARLQQRLEQNGVKELIVACPNCYNYLKDRLTIPVVSVYEKLIQFGYAEKKRAISGKVFLPCPDRYEKKWLSEIQQFFKTDLTRQEIHGVQCCGLGGCVGKREESLIRDMGDKIRRQSEGMNLYTYCASCSGKLTSREKEAIHLLTVITGTKEKPAVSKGWINRLAHKWHT